ncbi:MAG TPA: hypothetical protein VFQ85_00710 [Mycobacteriales bacterium]|jgi:hypothetical protein|nr:hypothetical protein [Mycobacteriales bacterium]
MKYQFNEIHEARLHDVAADYRAANLGRRYAPPSALRRLVRRFATR